ncbi:MAG TPA: hypothetical protein PLN69_00030 [bacterium]|nr:hypothetical protein [bacterium]
MVTQVGERISVLARFSGAKFEPLKFAWNRRLHRISSVNGRWAEHDGEYRIYHFAVVSDTDTFYELSFHTRNMRWILDRYMAGDP